MPDSPVAPKQMQVRVTFYTSHNPQSVLMILKHDCALEQIAEKAGQLFPSADYRLFYGDVNGPIYEFTDSEQVMAKIRITTFSRTPQLFVRLEPMSMVLKKSDKSKSSTTLKRIEQNQEQTMKTLAKMQRDFQRVKHLEEAVADLQSNAYFTEPKKRHIQSSKHSATCDACLGDIIGHRYKCLECPDFDLCENCEKNSVHYEHAMIRLVCPRKTSIPSYITANAPNNVFPAYMKANIIHLDYTLPASESKQPQPNLRADTRAALMQSASMLKDTFHTLSKSFLDLADGAQTGMDTKLFERSKMEAGMAMVEDKIEFLTRQCEEKYFGAPEAKVEKKEEPERKETLANETLNNPLLLDRAVFGNYEPKIKKTMKKKSVYKKTGAKLSSSFLAAMDKEEAKRRTEASTAELQRKLAELNTKDSEEPLRTMQYYTAPFSPYGSFGDFINVGPAGGSGMSFADWYNKSQQPTSVPNTSVPSPLSVLSAMAVNSYVGETSTPASIYPSIPTAPFMDSVPTPQQQEEEKMESLVEQLTTQSIHSSFENIASDFESISPSWAPSPTEMIGSIAPEAVEAIQIPQQIQNVEEMRVVENSDDDMEFYDGEETMPEVITEQPLPVETEQPVVMETVAAPEQVLSVVDAQTENTFDRLLEMGFEYNVVVAAIKQNGSDLTKCIQSLIP